MPKAPINSFRLAALLALLPLSLHAEEEIPPLPAGAKLVLEEDWSREQIDRERWYLPRKQWGRGNRGVTPENVRIETDTVHGRRKPVLLCEAHGDKYSGPVLGLGERGERVGGIIVSKEFFASGRFEVTMKIGQTAPSDAGPADPTQPRGAVPAIWTYAYRYVEGDPQRKGEFTREAPLYNPHMPAYGIAANEYWSELDFPEFGKAGEFGSAMYNTFCQNRHETRTFETPAAADGEYHTYTTEWRTKLEPLAEVRDAQVIEHAGYWWIHDREVPFELYLGNPLKRLGPDEYAVYTGASATHWLDGRRVGANERFVPSMAAQLTLGVWLPEWAGEAPWEVSRVSFAAVRVWQYGDAGDVRGILTEDLADNFDARGRRLE